MRLEIDNSFLQDFSELFSNVSEKFWAQQLEKSSGWGRESTVNFELAHLDDEEIDKMYKLAKAQGKRSVMVNLTGVISARQSKGKARITKFRVLDEAIRSFVDDGFIDGWLYFKDSDDMIQPWAVESIKYNPPSRNESESVFVNVFCCAPMEKNSRATGSSGFTRRCISISPDYLSLGSVAEILYKKGYAHETEDLKKAYLESRKKLVEVVAHPYKQHWLQGNVLTTETGWSKKRVEIPFPTRCVFDEYEVTRIITEELILNNTDKNDDSLPVKKKVSVPLSMHAMVFDMERHKYFWAHVDLLTEYKFDPEMVNKIVLPETHRDLIEVLTQDLDIQYEDIVKGKSGGTTILCKGSPGLGKTLTAEVFSESVKTPLYRVHSGQIGYDPEQVESNLREILQRGQRWGAAVLIDEADVFIRERGNDVVHNAIVSAFLRTLEYYSGLLFLTTNRSDDIDDAILSRCTAIVKYEYPDRDQSIRLWKVLSKQGGVQLSDDLCAKLADLFNNEVAGRDIKKLIDLTARYAAKKKLEMDVDLFRRCALFKGMI